MKKNIYKWFVPALFSVFILVSCDNYLDVQPKGMQVLETVADYDQWLNSTELETSLPDELNLLADNVDNLISIPATSINDRVYSWQPQFSEELDVSPVIWANHYKCIYYFNTVLQGIDEATGGTEEQKASLKAEALLGRAFEYLYLVNLYGKAYNPNTSSEDLAVPFVTSNDLTDPVPSRSTVQDIYDHIVEDITTAIPDLPQDNSENRFRGSVAAAYSVLSRTYLYMGDYTKAAQNAQLVLDNGPNTIVDYSTMSEYINLMIRPNTIYARINKWYDFITSPTLTFLKTFDTIDLRLQLYYSDLGDYSFTTRRETQYESYGGVLNNGYPKGYPNWGISVAEMRLIIAEAAARSSDLGTACDELDLVRKCRFPEFIIDSINYDVPEGSSPDTVFSYKYKKFESTNQEEVLQKVLAERTFEFPYCGMRWFDMRRLDAEGRMPEVNRYDGEGNVIATLSPGSNKYTLQIPIQVLYFNPTWPQNPTDE